MLALEEWRSPSASPPAVGEEADGCLPCFSRAGVQGRLHGRATLAPRFWAGKNPRRVTVRRCKDDAEQRRKWMPWSKQEEIMLRLKRTTREAGRGCVRGLYISSSRPWLFHLTRMTGDGFGRTRAQQWKQSQDPGTGKSAPFHTRHPRKGSSLTYGFSRVLERSHIARPQTMQLGQVERQLAHWEFFRGRLDVYTVAYWK